MVAPVEAVGKVAAWTAADPAQRDDRAHTSRRLAAISPPAEAEALSRRAQSRIRRRRPTPTSTSLENEPAHASMLRTSISPTIISGGYRINVIPSEAKATLDVRMLPDEDPAEFLELVQEGRQRSAGRGQFGARDIRPAGADARLDTEAFKAIESQRHEALQRDRRCRR